MTTTEPTVKRPAKKIVYAPMYSSHGHGRKTHIAVSGEGSLCGIEKRYTGLLYSQGPDYYSVEEQFLIDNPEPHRNGCLRCRKAYLKISSFNTTRKVRANEQLEENHKGIRPPRTGDE